MDTSQSTKQGDFKQSLEALGKIIEKLEQPGASLEQSLTYYQQGVELAEHCRMQLTKAKGIVAQVRKQQDTIVTQEFTSE